MKMGIWEYVSSTTDSIKRNAPDPTSVKNLCWSSCVYSRAAVDKLFPYLPDVEIRSMATSLAKQTAFVAVREGVKLAPGGSTVYEIASRSIPSEKKPKEYKENLQAFKDTVGRTQSEQDMMKRDLNHCRRLLEQNEMDKLIMEIKTKKALDLNKKPEDIVRVFATTEFTGKQYLDYLIAPSPEVTLTPKESTTESRKKS